MTKRKRLYIGLDIGGSKIEGILWAGRVVESLKIRTPKSRQNFFAAFFDLIKKLSNGKKISGIGVVVAGNLDLAAGRVFGSPNMGFLRGVSLKTVIQSKLHIPVRIDNDAKGFLRGEMKFGLARGRRNVVALTLGTGVGGAVAIDGRILRGTHGTGFELGNIVIESKGERGLTLEDLVSRHGFLKLGVRFPLDAQNKAFAGDRKSIKVYDTVGRHLGRGLATLINIFDPELIVLGGGIARARELLVKPALKEAKKYALHSLRKLPPVKVSNLKNAAVLGAVSLFLD